MWVEWESERFHPRPEGRGLHLIIDNIFQSISEKPSLPEETEINADLSLCNKFISYHDYQISALKSIHASNGDYTIYSTIETDDDVVFVVISGT